MNKQTLKCTVLSVEGVPIQGTSSQRGLVMVLLDKAYVVENHKDIFFRSVNKKFAAPKTIRIHRYIHLPDFFYGEAKLNLDSLKKRDKNVCQYCGRKSHELKPKEFFTIDHVFPVSRGGEHIWENVLLSCVTCNNRKDDKTPKEAGMVTLNKPRSVTTWQLNNLMVEK